LGVWNGLKGKNKKERSLSSERKFRAGKQKGAGKHILSKRKTGGSNTKKKNTVICVKRTNPQTPPVVGKVLKCAPWKENAIVQVWDIVVATIRSSTSSSTPMKPTTGLCGGVREGQCRTWEKGAGAAVGNKQRRE